MNRKCRCLNCITPPHLLKKLLENKDKNIREAALNTLLATARLRGERTIRALTFAAAPGTARRTIYDCRHRTRLSSAVLARSEDGKASADESVNLAYDGFGFTKDFYREVLSRNSIDGRGMRLEGFVHRGHNYNNAFWDGQEMVFGDGDGVLFTDFTRSIDVIAHELTHGVTEFTAGLEYQNQSGALNESISDVFGSLVKQWVRHETADEADWLIGSEIFTPGLEADALRSMKAPGTAYNNNVMGKDPQPDSMDGYEELPNTEDGDNGGVHINSGIPNKAFYLTATGIGGYAWEAAGHIWYESLLASNKTTEFQAFANTTVAKADALYGIGSAEHGAVVDAWREVGIRVTSAATVAQAPEWNRLSRGAASTSSIRKSGTDQLAALRKQVETLAAQVKVLTGDGNGRKLAEKQ